MLSVIIYFEPLLAQRIISGSDGAERSLHTLYDARSLFTNPSMFQCLNRDGVTINLDVSYQFKAVPQHLYDLVVQFKDFEAYQKVLGAAGKHGYCLINAETAYIGLHTCIN